MSSIPFLGISGFVQGWMEYIDRYPGSNDYRIVISAKFGNLPLRPVILDTGAPWCILGPEEARNLDFDYKAEYIDKTKILIRGTRYEGWLCRIPLTPQAVEGDSMTIDSTTFIPEISGGITWSNPNFVGLEGFLDRIRFAIDPGKNRFYFGAIQ